MRVAPSLETVTRRSKWATTVGKLCEKFEGDVQTGPFGSQLHASDYSDNGTPVVMPQDMQGGTIVCDRIARVNAKHVKQLSRHMLRAGDVVFSRRGDVARFAVITAREEGWLCGTGSIRIRLNCPEVDIGYLRHYLQQDIVGDWLRHNAKGVTMPNLNTAIVSGLPFVYPPMPEQRRIAGILDKAEALRAKRRQAIAKLDQLLQSVFLDMFGDPVANPKAWPLIGFTEIGKWKSGATPSKGKSAYWQGEFPWVSPKDMKVSEISDSQDHISERALEETNLKRIEPGHLLIVVRGMILAHSFPTAINTVPVAINQDMKAIHPADGIDVAYLKAAIDSLKLRILSIVSTAGHGTRRLDTRAASEVMIPIPPLNLQRKFRQFVSRAKLIHDHAKQQADKHEYFFHSLQSKAFSGML